MSYGFVWTTTNLDYGYGRFQEVEKKYMTWFHAAGATVAHDGTQ